MKLREDVQKNRVWTHGSVYVDPNEFIPICPECCSDKVEKVTEDDETCDITSYTCTDCGCKFDAWKGSERTKLGKAVHAIIVVVMVLLVIVAAGFCIFGVVWAKKKKTELGCDINDTIVLKSFGLALGIPFLCGCVEAILSKIDDKI